MKRGQKIKDNHIIMISHLTVQTKMERMPWLSDESLGLVLITISAMLFSVMGVFIKFATGTDLPSTELVFLRAVFQGAITIVAMTQYTDGSQKLIWCPFGSPRARRFIVARGAVGGFGFICFFYAISALPLGDAVALLSLTPVVTVFAAAIFLGETLRPAQLGAAVACSIGAILISRPSFLFGMDNEVSSSPDGSAGTRNTFGYLVALVGSFCGSGVFCLMRLAGKSGAHTLQLVFSWAAFGVFYSLTIGLLGSQVWQWPSSLQSWGFVLGIAAFGSVAHFLLNYAGRIAPAGLSSIVRSSQIVWSYAWEMIIFSQVPRISTIIGVACICTSLVLIAIEKVQDNAKNDAEIKNDLLQKQSDEESTVQLHESYGSTE
jgi:drug/metabolite transporter (DMT)-like permease